MLLVNDLSSHIQDHRPVIESAIQRVLDSGWLILGTEVAQFETEFAAYVGTGRCVSVANGTDALELSLRALGICRHDQVAMAANAGMYACSAITALGADPYFLDVDDHCFSVTPYHVAQAIASGAKAIVVTHLFGIANPYISTIAQQCRSNDIVLVEDCAQAHGARLDGRHVGTFGDAGCFSFYPTKNLGALGDGGAIVTAVPQLADSLRALRQYGWTTKYNAQVPGGRNSRLDEIQAAVLRETLPYLDQSNDQRRTVARRYSSGIHNPAVQTPNIDGERYVAHLYVIRTKSRDHLQSHLQQRGIDAAIHYPVPDHRQPIFGNRFANVRLPNTERLASELLSLPCYPGMNREAIDLVITAINEWNG